VADQLTAVSDSERREARRAVEGLGIAERSLLATHVADSIRFQPSRQADLAASLVAVVNDSDEVASAAVWALGRMTAPDIEPALIITLVPPAGGERKPFVDLVTEWDSEGALSPEAARAARLALRGTA